jgi:hypothetical protein
MIKHYFLGAVAASLLLFSGVAQAADLTSSPVLTLVGQVQATVVSQLYNTNGAGVVCTFTQTAHTSSPSTVFSIQDYDPATNSYFTVLSSGAVTADATPNPAMVYPVTVPGSLPGVMVMIGVKMTPQFRISAVVGGTGTTTAKVGCINLK